MFSGPVGLVVEVTNPSIVLASESPQRREILGRLGLEFQVKPVEITELTEGDPRTVAKENALLKVRAAADLMPDSELVLGVDTLVSVGRRIFGKPSVEADASSTIEALSGIEHTVISGLSVVDSGKVRTRACTTKVKFRVLDRRTIDWYVGTGEWRDRAGGYAIQERGIVLVESIEGDYMNVVGLPITLLLEMVPDILWR